MNRIEKARPMNTGNSATPAPMTMATSQTAPVPTPAAAAGSARSQNTPSGKLATGWLRRIRTATLRRAASRTRRSGRRSCRSRDRRRVLPGGQRVERDDGRRPEREDQLRVLVGGVELVVRGREEQLRHVERRRRRLDVVGRGAEGLLAVDEDGHRVALGDHLGRPLAVGHQEAGPVRVTDGDPAEGLVAVRAGHVVVVADRPAEVVDDPDPAGRRVRRLPEHSGQDQGEVAGVPGRGGVDDLAREQPVASGLDEEAAQPGAVLVDDGSGHGEAHGHTPARPAPVPVTRIRRPLTAP